MRTKALGILAGVVLCTLAQAEEKKVSLTVYNQNLGLVREIRELEFAKGKNEIKFTGVASQIDPTSVHFQGLGSGTVSILEQNYQYDLVSSEKLLERYLDQGVELHTKEGEVFSGQLLAFDGANLTLREKNGSIRIVSRGNVLDITFPSLPEGLITRPTLVWSLDSDYKGKKFAEVSYLTNGINWHAEYVAVVDQLDKNLDLSGWVSIENNSGATYPDAKLKLIAGDIHRAEEPRRGGYAMDAMKTAEMAAPAFEEKSFFEYHLYTLTRPATVKDREIKQISLFPNTTVKALKKLIYDGDRYGTKVRVNMEFDNSAKAGLGMPLPKGKIRVYKQDTDKSLEFIGEDLIDHTPRDEKVRIFVGNAFDVVGERKQTDYEKVSSKAERYSYEVSLRNHKKEAIEVAVVEHVYYGDWEITKSDHPYTKKDAFTVEFNVSLNPDSEKKINYTVLYQH